MKRVKKVLSLILAISLSVVSFNVASAEEVQETKKFGSAIPVMDETQSTFFDCSDKVETGRVTKVTYEDDLIIEETVISYAQVTSNVAAISELATASTSATSYKTDWQVKIHNISTGSGKQLLRVDQFVEFKYNGKYAYVSDKSYVYYVYNGASFVNRSSSYTKKVNKSSSLAKYVISGDLKWKIGSNSYKNHWKFKITCKPSGVINTTAVKS